MSQRPRRWLFRHPAHKTIGVRSGQSLSGGASSANSRQASAETRNPLKVSAVSGPLDRTADAMLSKFLTHLRERFDAEFDWASEKGGASGKGGRELPVLESADRPDCLILFGRQITGSELRHVCRYCRGGGSVIGIGSLRRDFWGRLSSQRRLFGASCRGGWREHVALQVSIPSTAEGHPVVENVRPFAVRGRFPGGARLSAGTTPLLTTSTLGLVEPVAWVHTRGGGRVFCTSLGSLNDFRQTSFVSLLVNALAWTIGQPPLAGISGR